MSDKLRLDYFLSVGGKLVAGDMLKSKHKEPIEVMAINAYIFNTPSVYDDGITITSFADRNNRGKQPVQDDFPVIAGNRMNQEYLSATCFNWKQSALIGCVTTWKPDYEVLLKMQAKHDKHNESIIKACDEANKKESEMVYTQEMFDNNIAPKRGMKVLVGGLEPESRIIDFEGASVTIVNVHSASNLITFSHGLIGCGCGYFSAEKKVFHPIKTPEQIELEEAKKKQLEDMCFKYKNLPLEVAMQMQKNGDLPEIVIDDLSVRGMAKQ